jgi:hypothetical protein
MGQTFAGTITAGITLTTATVQNPATIAGGAYVSNIDTTTTQGAAVLGNTDAWTVTNLGTVEGVYKAPGTLGTGIQLNAGGLVINGESSATGALIAAPFLGIQIQNAAGTVVNYGTISGEVSLKSGGTVNNLGTIYSLNQGGIAVAGGGMVTNSGVINAFASAITFATSGSNTTANHSTVSNSGTIIAAQTGVALTTGGVLTNAGTVAGAVGANVSGTVIDSGLIAGSGAGAIVFGSTGSNLLVLDNGYRLVGGVSGGDSATNTLELAGAAGDALTVHYNSLRLSNFQDVLFGPGGSNVLQVTNATGTLPVTISGLALASDSIDLSAIGSNGTDTAFDTIADRVTIAGSLGSVTLQFDPSDTTSLITRPDGTGGTSLVVRPPPPRDFAGDGRSEVLWQSTTGNVDIWDLNGLSVAGSAIVGFADPAVWTIAGTGDFNGDRVSDILWRDTSGNVDIWEMNGNTVAASAIVGVADPSTWTIAGTGDFNGDGKSDILWQDTGGDVAIWEMNGGTVAASAVVGFANSSVWHIAGTGDFNGDGLSDILWQDSSGDVAIWEMSGLSVAASAVVGFADPTSWHIAGTGDFTGDGKSDILWQDQSGNVAIWEMNGFSIAASAVVGFADPAAWRIAGIGDYNGDGKSDILWQDTRGDVAVWEMNGLGVAATGLVGVVDPSMWHIVPADDFGDIAIPAPAATLSLPPGGSTPLLSAVAPSPACLATLHS